MYHTYVPSDYPYGQHAFPYYDSQYAEQQGTARAPPAYQYPQSHMAGGTVEDLTRWAVPAATVRMNLGSRGITPSFNVYSDSVNVGSSVGRDSSNPRVLREQLREITNKRAQSSEAFEMHARSVQYILILRTDLNVHTMTL